MDPSDLCVTPGRGGSSSSDGNGGRSVDTSPRRRRLMPSSPAGNSAADGGGSGSPSAGPDHSRRRVNPEDSPTPNQVRPVLLVSPVRSPAAMDDDVLIMDGMLVDNGPGTTSSARRSVSFVDNGPGNMRSVSISDLVLVSSGSRGGGSGSRRSGFSGEFDPTGDREEPRGTQSQGNRYSEGSSNRRQAQGADPSNVQHGQQGAGPSNVQQGQQFPLNHNVQQGQQLPLYYNIQQEQWYPWYPFHMIPPPPLAAFTFAPDRVTIPSSHYNPPVNIRYPDGTPLSLPPPPPKRSESRVPVVIRAPPTNKGGTSAPEQPEAQATPPAPEQPEAQATPEQPETQATLPAPEQPETQAPPTVDEEYAIWKALYGTSGRRRLPVFKDICPDGTEGLPPPPPPPPAPPCQ